MFNFFKKLLIARQLKVEKGSLEMLGERMLIMPAYTFSYIIKSAEDQDKIGRLIYNACKHANNDPRGFTYDVSKKFNLKGEDLIKWMADIATTSGWGIIDIVRFDGDKKTATIMIKDSPVAKNIQGAKNPVDHPIRGYMAGAAEVVFNDLSTDKKSWIKYDYVETKCVACGSQFCSFELMPREQLRNSSDKRIRELFRIQVGDQSD